MTPVTLVAARLRLVGRRGQLLAAALWPLVLGAGADLIVLVGLAAIVYGVALLSRPAAWIVAGLLCVVIGVRGSMAAPPPPTGGEH